MILFSVNYCPPGQNSVLMKNLRRTILYCIFWKMALWVFVCLF